MNLSVLRHRVGASIAFFLLISFSTASTQTTATQPAATQPTVAEAEAFMKDAEARLADIGVKAGRAAWVQENFITDDTQIIAAEANDQFTALVTDLATKAKRFDGLNLPPELARKMMLLRLALSIPAPSNPVERQEETKIESSLDADYGKGKYCRKDGKCLDITAMESLFATDRNPNDLLDMWVGWHKVGAPMRDRYARLVDLANKGAREMGFADVGALWRSNYDMPPDQFSAELERLWQQVRPLYLSLHAYVRTQLGKKYGTNVVPPNGMIPAHLLGNMWAQEWGNIYPLVAPGQQTGSIDLTALLKQHNVAPIGMVHYGENFFKSLGFAPLPQTFWERSLFTKPADRDVVCHASAWDVDNKDDLRLKVCLQVRADDFITVHHELGHNFYQRAYKNQPTLFEDGANDGFHEAIGDTIALAVTPEYLHEVGLLAQVPPANNTSDIALLLKQALDKVAFLPFGLLIDQWRWRVYSGEIKPADYNKSWWEMREKYQGVSPPVSRSEADFDPGAKYHVPGNVPYTRYFLARILQFQFYRAMCREAGYKGPLYRCTFYNSKAAGDRLNKMLEMGRSRPWPEALKELTGEDHMDAGAMLEYFAPLQAWLDQQNKGVKVGW
jgi:peptidyl-dipeptidase A